MVVSSVRQPGPTHRVGATARRPTPPISTNVNRARLGRFHPVQQPVDRRPVGERHPQKHRTGGGCNTSDRNDARRGGVGHPPPVRWAPVTTTGHQHGAPTPTPTRLPSAERRPRRRARQRGPTRRAPKAAPTRTAALDDTGTRDRRAPPDKTALTDSVSAARAVAPTCQSMQGRACVEGGKNRNGRRPQAENSGDAGTRAAHGGSPPHATRRRRWRQPRQRRGRGGGGGGGRRPAGGTARRGRRARARARVRRGAPRGTDRCVGSAHTRPAAVRAHASSGTRLGATRAAPRRVTAPRAGHAEGRGPLAKRAATRWGGGARASVRSLAAKETRCGLLSESWCFGASFGATEERWIGGWCPKLLSFRSTVANEEKRGWREP